MNTKILEKIKAAATLEKMDLTWGRSSELDPEKFAELIVNECLTIISDESDKVESEWRCKDGKHIWWKIAEHFGVEKDIA